MCLSPDAFVAARVYHRLTSAGVKPARAEKVAEKIARRYRTKRNLAYIRHMTAAENLPIPGQLSIDD